MSSPVTTSTETTTTHIPSAPPVHQSKALALPTTRDPLAKSDTDHFFWTYTEEPHRTRRQAIIKAHPEVTKLCGPEPLTKYLVLLVVSIQLSAAFLLRSTPILSWTFFLTAYCVGATANQNLFLAIHEISHNLAFRSPNANRALAIFGNLPIGVPYYASFRVSAAFFPVFPNLASETCTIILIDDSKHMQPYHLTHHKSLGVDGLDTDLPTALEAMFLDSVLGKAFFATFQIFFYALRPMFVYQIPMTKVHLVNVLVQIAFDYLLVRTCSWNSLAYLITSSFLAGSLHPCAAHFIAEHYVFSQHQDASLPASPETAKVPTPETFSYYGPLNALTYNVGLHNEHHDFPAVPWTRLGKLHDTAREFYDELPSHRSWVLVIWQFLSDERVGLWCRVKRGEGGRKVGVRADNLKANGD